MIRVTPRHAKPSPQGVAGSDWATATSQRQACSARKDLLSSLAEDRLLSYPISDFKPKDAQIFSHSLHAQASKLTVWINRLQKSQIKAKVSSAELVSGQGSTEKTVIDGKGQRQTGT